MGSIGWAEAGAQSCLRAAFFCVNYMLPIFILFKLQQAFTLMYAVIISRSICSEVYF